MPIRIIQKDTTKHGYISIIARCLLLQRPKNGILFANQEENEYIHPSLVNLDTFKREEVYQENTYIYFCTAIFNKQCA